MRLDDPKTRTAESCRGVPRPAQAQREIVDNEGETWLPRTQDWPILSSRQPRLSFVINNLALRLSWTRDASTAFGCSRFWIIKSHWPGRRTVIPVRASRSAGSAL